MKTIIAILFCLWASSVSAADWKWDAMDYTREAISLGITVVDWGQTNDIRRHEGMIELNPLLGPHPSKSAVRDYFVTVLVLHPLISAALPKQAELFGCAISPRLAWQYIYLGVEATATLSNYHGGLRVSF